MEERLSNDFNRNTKIETDDIEENMLNKKKNNNF